MREPATGTIRLVAATDAHFAALAANKAPDGFGLPESGIDAPESSRCWVLWLRPSGGRSFPAAWLIVNNGEVVGLCSIAKAFTSPGVVEIAMALPRSGAAVDLQREPWANC